MISSLILSAGLSEPPTDPLAFRSLTLACRATLNLNILLETSSSAKDLFYHYLKNRGMLDYVDDILEDKERVEGLRIVEYSQVTCPRPKVRIKSIRLENQLILLGRIKSFI